jgi:hypothetical protein
MIERLDGKGKTMLVLYHNDMSLCAQKVRVCLAEKGLPWENRHLVLRAGEHQQPWYRKLNRRAVVPTLIDGDNVIPESNVILEYLEEICPHPPLASKDAYSRARMRLWMKQLDEDVHDSSAAILSFGIAFRHQYIEAGALGKKMLEQVPNVFKRERRRDVIEKGTSSQHFVVAVERMMLLQKAVSLVHTYPVIPVLAAYPVLTSPRPSTTIHVSGMDRRMGQCRSAGSPLDAQQPHGRPRGAARRCIPTAGVCICR